MRVIAGSRRSMPLKTMSGNETRPTTDRIKETLFNILMPYIPECRFLDLFAGTGGIGIEALSRGASYACFVDNNQKAINVIKDNVAFTKFGDQSTILKTDSVRLLSTPNRIEPYDVIFVDPPYNNNIEEEVIKAASEGSSWIADDALFIIEASIKTDFSWTEKYGCEIIKIKEYKTNKHVFLKLNR